VSTTWKPKPPPRSSPARPGRAQLCPRPRAARVYLCPPRVRHRTTRDPLPYASTPFLRDVAVGLLRLSLDRYVEVRPRLRRPRRHPPRGHAPSHPSRTTCEVRASLPARVVPHAIRPSRSGTGRSVVPRTGTPVRGAAHDNEPPHPPRRRDGDAGGTTRGWGGPSRAKSGPREGGSRARSCRLQRLSRDPPRGRVPRRSLVCSVDAPITRRRSGGPVPARERRPRGAAEDPIEVVLRVSRRLRVWTEAGRAT
jgi:hypothetical protein